MRSGRGFEGTRDLAAHGRKEMPARQNGVHALGLVDAQRRCRVHARPRLWCPALPCCEDAAALSPSLSPPLPPTSVPSLEPADLPPSRNEELTPIMAAARTPSSTSGQSLF